MDALIGGGPDSPAYELVADATRSLLPVMEKLKITTAAEVDLSSLAQRMRDEVVASKGVVLSPGLIGARCHGRSHRINFCNVSSGIPRGRCNGFAILRVAFIGDILALRRSRPKRRTRLKATLPVD
jgi:hypothetical protein